MRDIRTYLVILVSAGFGLSMMLGLLPEPGETCSVCSRNQTFSSIRRNFGDVPAGMAMIAASAVLAWAKWRNLRRRSAEQQA